MDENNQKKEATLLESKNQRYLMGTIYAIGLSLVSGLYFYSIAKDLITKNRFNYIPEVKIVDSTFFARSDSVAKAYHVQRDSLDAKIDSLYTQFKSEIDYLNAQHEFRLDSIRIYRERGR
jgi:hypothetical protein